MSTAEADSRFYSNEKRSVLQIVDELRLLSSTINLNRVSVTLGHAINARRIALLVFVRLRKTSRERYGWRNRSRTEIVNR